MSHLRQALLAMQLISAPGALGFWGPAGGPWESAGAPAGLPEVLAEAHAEAKATGRLQGEALRAAVLQLGGGLQRLPALQRLHRRGASTLLHSGCALGTGGDPSCEFEQGVKILNDRFEVTQRRIDALFLECSQRRQQGEASLASIGTDVTGYQASRSGNVGEQKAASEKVDSQLANVKKLQAMAASTRQQCRVQARASSVETTLLGRDVATAKTLENVAKHCRESMLLLQSTSCAMLPALGELRHLARRLRSGFAQGAFQQALRRASRRAVLARGGTALLQESRRGSSQDYGSASMWPTDKRGGLHGCEGSKPAVDCGGLWVELRRMSGRVKDELGRVVSRHRDDQERCRDRQNHILIQIRMAQRTASAASVRLSKVMGDAADLASMLDHKQKEQADLSREMGQEAEQCRKNLAMLRKQAFSIVRVRQAILDGVAGKTSGVVQDCTVSDWAPSECSQKCAAGDEPNQRKPGSMKLTRSIMMPPGHLGASCPPLAAEVSCGGEPCPVDCNVGAWSSWASCTKACGGGTRIRSRGILRPAKFGGEVCPPAEELAVCNTMSCDRDCELKQWSDWSTCSRSCRFGNSMVSAQQIRKRFVKQRAVGQGKCPSSLATSRMEVRACEGTPACPNQAKMRCNSSQDVVLVLDSAGGNDASFKAQLGLAEWLLDHSAVSDAGMGFGAVVYGDSAKVLTQISTNAADVKAALKSATPSAGGPNVAAGATAARGVLRSSGDEGKAGVVLLLASGSPSEYSTARTAARNLRQMGARLLLGYVDDFSTASRQKACGLVEAPCSANIEAVASWQDMSSSPGRLLSAICGAGDLGEME